MHPCRARVQLGQGASDPALAKHADPGGGSSVNAKGGRPGLLCSRRAPLLRTRAEYRPKSPRGVHGALAKLVAVLKCEECQCSSETGFGWIALIVDDEDDPEWEPYVVAYCPACAARELEYRLKRG